MANKKEICGKVDKVEQQLKEMVVRKCALESAVQGRDKKIDELEKKLNAVEA